jgi:hypothetical protein
MVIFFVVIPIIIFIICAYKMYLYNLNIRTHFRIAEYLAILFISFIPIVNIGLLIDVLKDFKSYTNV